MICHNWIDWRTTQLVGLLVVANSNRVLAGTIGWRVLSACVTYCDK